MDYKQKYLKYKQKYLKMLRDQKGGKPFLSDILALPAYSWLIIMNKKQLKHFISQKLMDRLFTGRQLNLIPLGMISLNAHNRLKLIAQSSLGVVLARKFVNFQNPELLILIIERMSRLRISEPTCVATLAGHSDAVWSVAFHPREHVLATSSDDRTIKLWK